MPMGRHDIDRLRFDERGLVPAIVQQHDTREVLMLAYMDAEALTRTLDGGETVFWSRSRQEYWHKGATSGHTQQVVAVHADCDRDAVLVVVDIGDGVACHTGARSCFDAHAADAAGLGAANTTGVPFEAAAGNAPSARPARPPA